MTNKPEQISLRVSALIAGFSLLIMAIAAPFAELYVFPKLIVSGNAEDTTKNILMNPALFRAGVFGYLIAFICDILVAWALYVLLKPVNASLSQLTAWLRLVYTIITLVALTNLVYILRLLDAPDSLTAIDSNRLFIEFDHSIKAFRNSWDFGILFFGLHLGLLGFLVFRSNYIPKILGVLLIISGSGYLMNGLKPFLLPAIKMDFAIFTFFGELIFMLWLIIRGFKIKEPDLEII
jgi:hypothetical protein